MLPEAVAARGWEEVGILGIGAGGPVLLIRRRQDVGTAKQFALKRSTAAEIAALQELARCRNVVALHEHFAGGGAGELWARLEWLEGGTLRGFLRRRGPGQLPEDAVRFILGGVLAGLEEIHRLGWMHRDIKAENIGLSAELKTDVAGHNCHVKLLDFDAATRIPASGRLTEAIGTVENMAPEVFGCCYDERADCWSVGIVAYETLFGYRPFNDASIDRVEEMVRNWQRYLLFPFDAPEAAAGFIRGLLTGREGRMSAGAAADHSWLCGRTLPGRPGAAAGEPLAPAAHGLHYQQPVPARASPAVDDRARQGCAGHAGHAGHASGSRPRAAPAAPVEASNASASRPAADAGVLQDGEELEGLQSIRRSLSEWTAAHFDGGALGGAGIADVCFMSPAARAAGHPSRAAVAAKDCPASLQLAATPPPGTGLPQPQPRARARDPAAGPEVRERTQQHLGSVPQASGRSEAHRFPSPQSLPSQIRHSTGAQQFPLPHRSHLSREGLPGTVVHKVGAGTGDAAGADSHAYLQQMYEWTEEVVKAVSTLADWGDEQEPSQQEQQHQQQQHQKDQQHQQHRWPEPQQQGHQQLRKLQQQQQQRLAGGQSGGRAPDPAALQPSLTTTAARQTEAGGETAETCALA